MTGTGGIVVPLEIDALDGPEGRLAVIVGVVSLEIEALDGLGGRLAVGAVDVVSLEVEALSTWDAMISR